MADILHDSSEIERSSGGLGKVTNPSPEAVDPSEPAFVRLGNYRIRGLGRTVYVEEIVAILGDLIMTNATDEEVKLQSEKWDVVVRSSAAWWDCLDEGYVALVNNKAVEGVCDAGRNFESGPPAFWVMGNNLKAVYNALARAGIFINVYDEYWYEEK